MPSQDAPAPQQISQVSTSAPPGFVQPFITGEGLPGALEGKDPNAFLPRVFNQANQPFQPLPTAADRIEPFDPSEVAGLGAIEANALAGSPETAAIRDFSLGQLTQTPGQNPLVDQLVGTAQSDIVNQFNTNVAPQIAAANRTSGSFGNTGLSELESSKRFSLARALGDVETQIRLPQFNQDVLSQFAAAPLAQAAGDEPFLNAQRLLAAGGARRQFGQAARDVGIQNRLQERAFPLQQLDILGAGLQTAGGGFGQTTAQGQQFQRAAPNPFLTGLASGGAALGGLGGLISAFGP
jgi:hypothetical protein